MVAQKYLPDSGMVAPFRLCLGDTIRILILQFWRFWLHNILSQRPFDALHPEEPIQLHNRVQGHQDDCHHKFSSHNYEPHL